MILYIVFGLVLFFGFMAFTGAPYVPSLPRQIDRAFKELYLLSDADTLIDIGSGDGIVLRHAVKSGARAVGYEINPLLALISRVLSFRDPNIKIVVADYRRVDFPPETTVVYAFGDGRDIARMAAKVEEQAAKLGRTLAFISNGFEVPGRRAVKSVGPYHLYQIEALPNSKP